MGEEMRHDSPGMWSIYALIGEWIVGEVTVYLIQFIRKIYDRTAERIATILGFAEGELCVVWLCVGLVMCSLLWNALYFLGGKDVKALSLLTKYGLGRWSWWWWWWWWGWWWWWWWLYDDVLDDVDDVNNHHRHQAHSGPIDWLHRYRHPQQSDLCGSVRDHWLWHHLHDYDWLSSSSAASNSNGYPMKLNMTLK